ncbi:nickel ABC transporter permease [Paenibacillus sp. 1-18]|uniref:nickel ABC transporter permease n=1 Tax=Paenibacillus sp. 1-18 TaxID=1333846 RepID=UPI000472F5B5|nr:nickel ABC transporter permease [Paenibacillus sp. 1-18]
MIRFILERAAQLVIIVFAVSTVTFVLMRLAPGDPATILLTAHNVPASEEALTALRKELGLNEPLHIQYVNWLRDVFTGHWGTSYVSKESVLAELWNRLPATVELASAGFAVMTMLTLGMGLAASVKSSGPLDRLSRLLALLGSSIPSFWLGFLLIYLFSVCLGWLPSMGRENWTNLVLPALTLGAGLGAVQARVLRAQMLELGDQNFVKAARARGFSHMHILFFELFKHAILPIFTLLGTNLSFMLAGNVIVETIFSWPGLGKYFIDAITQRDYPVIQGYVIFASFLIVGVQCLVDVVQTAIDPRLRLR